MNVGRRIVMIMMVVMAVEVNNNSMKAYENHETCGNNKNLKWPMKIQIEALNGCNGANN